MKRPIGKAISGSIASSVKRIATLQTEIDNEVAQFWRYSINEDALHYYLHSKPMRESLDIIINKLVLQIMNVNGNALTSPELRENERVHEGQVYNYIKDAKDIFELQEDVLDLICEGLKRSDVTSIDYVSKLLRFQRQILRLEVLVNNVVTTYGYIGHIKDLRTEFDLVKDYSWDAHFKALEVFQHATHPGCSYDVSYGESLSEMASNILKYNEFFKNGVLSPLERMHKNVSGYAANVNAPLDCIELLDVLIPVAKKIIDYHECIQISYYENLDKKLSEVNNCFNEWIPRSRKGKLREFHNIGLNTVINLLT